MRKRCPPVTDIGALQIDVEAQELCEGCKYTIACHLGHVEAQCLFAAFVGFDGEFCCPLAVEYDEVYDLYRIIEDYYARS